MGLSSKKRITNKTNNLDELQKYYYAGQKKPDTKEFILLQTHLHEVQEQAKQIYSGRSQNSFVRITASDWKGV